MILEVLIWFCIACILLIVGILLGGLVVTIFSMLAEILNIKHKD